jgi:hypothetical protein
MTSVAPWIEMAEATTSGGKNVVLEVEGGRIWLVKP